MIVGFRLERTYALTFSGDLEGFEIDIRSTSVSVVMQLRETRLDEVEKIAELLAQHITRWNYEDEKGETLPITVDTLLGLESPVLAKIAKEWYRAATGVTAPLDEGLTVEETRLLESSIPIETS